jgi:hypothetical protein
LLGFLPGRKDEKPWGSWATRSLGYAVRYVYERIYLTWLI